MYETDYEIRLEVGENAYQVRFTRMTAWSGVGDDVECEEDYAENIEVLLGEQWLPLNDKEVNAITYKTISVALDKWLFDNPPDCPDYDGERGDYLYDLEHDK